MIPLPFPYFTRNRKLISYNNNYFNGLGLATLARGKGYLASRFQKPIESVACPSFRQVLRFGFNLKVAGCGATAASNHPHKIPHPLLKHNSTL